MKRHAKTHTHPHTLVLPPHVVAVLWHYAGIDDGPELLVYLRDLGLHCLRCERAGVLVCVRE